MKAMEYVAKAAGGAISEGLNPVCEAVKGVADAAKDCHSKNVDLAKTVLNDEYELKKIKETNRGQIVSDILKSDEISSEDKIICIKDFNDVEEHESDNLADVLSMGIAAGFMGFSIKCIKDIACTWISQTQITRRSFRYNVFHGRRRIWR